MAGRPLKRARGAARAKARQNPGPSPGKTWVRRATSVWRGVDDHQPRTASDIAWNAGMDERDDDFREGFAVLVNYGLVTRKPHGWYVRTPGKTYQDVVDAQVDADRRAPRRNPRKPPEPLKMRTVRVKGASGQMV